MKRPITLIAALLALALVGFLVHTQRNASTPQQPRTAPIDHTSPPAPTRASASSTLGNAIPMPSQVDDDPAGDLVLEGQVVNPQGQPVGGAIVTLGSAPRRIVTSEEDGSFSFDALVQRRYPVSARSETLIGGPSVVTLSQSSDPVVIRMHPGGGIRVEVVDVKSMPIAAAKVSLTSMHAIVESTDSEGIAHIHNLPPGTTVISVEAAGHARGHSIVMVPQGAANMGYQRIVLVPGVMIHGRVLDPAGQPVANAKVIAQESGVLMQLVDPKEEGVSSDSEGRFTLPSVQLGNMQLLAVHTDHTPSTSARFEVGQDGAAEVVVVMQESAALSGNVFESDGSAAAWATVRIASSQGSGLHRKMIADEKGHFEMKGLPRDTLSIYASTDQASSDNQVIDLTSKPIAKKIKLELALDGSIEGRVVDEAGTPIPEAQVRAIGDFWEGASVDEMRLRGPAFATTDGDGKFRLRGLPESKYRLSASRSMPEQSRGLQPGVAAATGDLSVSIVLATPASIVGRIETSDGKVPVLASVSLGRGHATPASKGRFRLSDIPPGDYQLSVRGPNFAPSFGITVKAEAGKEVDVGTIVVLRGRSISGRVLDQRGLPVANAELVLGKQVISDGTHLTPSSMGAQLQQQMGIRRTTSDAEGRFRLPGVSQDALTLVADHSETGRSLGYEVPKGDAKLEVDLKLLAVGGVKGIVSINGTPKAGVQVLIGSGQGSPHIVIVNSDERGEFYAQRVAVGEFKVSALLSTGGASSMAATKVTVEPGKIVEVALDIEEGEVKLAVHIEGKEGAQIDAAQVFLFKGAADVNNGGELNKLFLSAASSAKMGFAFGKGAIASFDKVSPGNYSVCVIPINGDMNDPNFSQKLQRHVEQLAVYCQQLQITLSPNEQSYSAIVPAMQPLPEK